MKYVQVIDGADNCMYPIYKCSDKDFFQIFPNGRKVEFIEDFAKRVGSKKAHKIGCRLWQNLVDKKKIKGLHGTLFCELWHLKQYYFAPGEWEEEEPKRDDEGYPDKEGRIWVPVEWGSGAVHGGPHWDVLKPEGGYDNVFKDKIELPKK